MMNMRHRRIWLWGVLACLLAALSADAMYLGDYAEDYATLNHRFTTRATTGIPTTLAGSPVVSVYKGSATDTEKTSAEAYITLAVDFDTVTGLNNLLIDLSGDAFFSTGEDYSIVITTGTVDSVSVVGETIATFSIENRWDDADTALAAVSPLGYHPDASSTITVGNQDAGTYESCATDDATRWTIGDEDGSPTIDVFCEFNMGSGRVASEVQINGYFNSADTQVVDVYAYDYIEGEWDKLSADDADLQMQDRAKDKDYQYHLAPEYTDLVTAAGEVKIRFQSDRDTTAGGDVLYIDHAHLLGQPDAACTAEALAEAVWLRAVRALTTPADYKATGFSTHAAADVWTAGSRELSTPASYKATGFSTHNAAAVWTAGSRALSTPGDYKADVSGLSTLDAAGIRTAVGLASANLDTQIATLPTTEPDAAGTASTLLGALETHGDSTWSTADVSALATTSALATHDGKLDTVDSNVDAVLLDTGTTIPGTITTAQTDLDTLTGSDGATLATAQGLYAPAKAGAAMTLATDAVSAAAVSAAAVTEIQAGLATTGADSDTLETLSDQLDAVANAGSGDTAVNADTLDDDGDDMYLQDGDGNGIDDGTIRAYVESEYAVGGRTVRATVTTDSTGAWVSDMYLNADVQYRIVGSASGYVVASTTVTP